MQYEELFTDRKRIGSNIEAIMRDRKCTKVRLSKELNVSRPTLDAILKGDIHNAGKYDEYIRRLLAYMQISDTILDNYKYLPDVDRMRCTSVEKDEVKEKLRGTTIPVVFGESAEKIVARAANLCSDGYNQIAIGYYDGIVDAINMMMTKLPDVVVGVVNVMNKHTASVVVDCGAKFIVSPCAIDEIGTFCKARDVFCMMGGTTVSEIIAASQKGCDVVCLYPYETVSSATCQAIETLPKQIELAPFNLGEPKKMKGAFGNLFIAK